MYYDGLFSVLIALTPACLRASGATTRHPLSRITKEGEKPHIFPLFTPVERGTEGVSKKGHRNEFM